MCPYVYEHIYIYTCMYIYIHTKTPTYTPTYTFIFIRSAQRKQMEGGERGEENRHESCFSKSSNIFLHTYEHINICMYINTYIYTYIYIYI